MEDYALGETCLMQFLRAQLDDPDPEPCGRCAVCTEPLFADPGPAELVREAVEFVRGRPVTFEPRKRWMGARRGNVKPGDRHEPGRGLSYANDPGWGRRVLAQRDAGAYDDELVDALRGLIDRWPTGATWVTAVPSLRRPELVGSLAERLAIALEVPFRPVVDKRRETPPQAQMENSAQQADNVDGVFAIPHGVDLSSDPVLLVDDVRDSGWTLTEVTKILRDAGAGPVYPVVLAVA
jgi:ATP-dependent DNA helicase RecQ